MKTSTILALFVAILILFGGTWWYMTQNAAMPQNNTEDQNNTINVNTNLATTTTTTTTSTTTTSTGVDAGVNVNTPKTVTVTYSSAGFSPKTVTINRGDTVRFVSEGGAAMWVGVDDHPTHTEYDGTSRTEHCAAGSQSSFDQCQTGSSYSFTFTKTGTFGYHNHVGASHSGTVVVK